MRAIMCPQYGSPDVLTLKDVPTPTPKANEVLVRVHVATVSSGDCRVRGLNTPRGFKTLMRLALGWSGPRQPILGTEVAGEVAGVGEGVSAFKEGDAVFGFGGAKMGCYAEYRCFDVDGLICAKPEGVTMEAAAALSFGGTTALDFFRRAGGVRPGWRVLVNGASGCVGGAAVQLAKHAGAEVTAVCSAANEAAVRGLGAAHVIDYARQPDITEAGAPYDVILDAVGNLPVERGLKALRRGGSLLLVVADLAQMLRAPWASWVSGRRVVAGPVAERPDDLRALAALASAGAFRPVIDRRFLLSQVAEAHRYVDTGRKRGSVILDVLG